MADGVAGYLSSGRGLTRVLVTVRSNVYNVTFWFSQLVTFCGAVSMSSADLAPYLSQAKFYNFTAWTGFLASIPLLLLHTLGVPRFHHRT